MKIIKNLPMIYLRNTEKLSFESEASLLYLCDAKYRNQFFKFNNKIYHFKITPRIAEELVGENISDFFDLQTVHSEISKIKFKRFSHKSICILLTEVFTNESHQYFSFGDFNQIKINDDIGLDNLNHLEYINHYKLSPKNLQELGNDLRKMIVCDFLTNQLDRHIGNFMFEKDKLGYVKLCPVFDYEKSLDSTKDVIFYNMFNLDLNSPKVLQFIRHDKYLQFLFIKAMSLNINDRLNQIENIYPIKFSSEERFNYTNCIAKKQNEIITKKLINK